MHLLTLASRSWYSSKDKFNTDKTPWSGIYLPFRRKRLVIFYLVVFQLKLMGACSLRLIFCYAVIVKRVFSCWNTLLFNISVRFRFRRAKWKKNYHIETTMGKNMYGNNYCKYRVNQLSQPTKSISLWYYSGFSRSVVLVVL